MTRITTIEWADVREKWLAVYNGQPNPGHADTPWRDSRKGSTSGVKFRNLSADQMAEYVRDGYTAPGMTISDDFMPTQPQRRLVFSEEGDLDYPLALSGYDYPYQAWQAQPRKPAIRIVAEFSFAAGVSGTVIAKYGTWLAGLMTGLEAQGYDLEVMLQCRTSGGQCQRYRGGTDVRIRVKRENEVSDFLDWSALFSPGGFRYLYFMAMHLAAERHGDFATEGLGSPVGRGYSAKWEPEEETLYIGSPTSARDFPEDEMTRKVQEALDL